MSSMQAKAHQKRNAAEYEGYLEQDEQLLADMLTATRVLKHVLLSEESG